LFSQYQVFYSPVVDKNNQLIGEINILDIFKIGLPDYTLMMPNINFLKSMEPFEELLTHEDQMLIKDIMIKPAVTITSDSPVIMAAYEMIQHGVMTIPVVSGNNYLGIINYSDILNKVLRV
jgi:Mg/Co/Ni transporter MgtE